ncbi:MAG: PIN domain-containing protein [Betaproteobacteria bacterium]|nr:MAG: PIN domain-containing protein [Betaproteobacteria bacterium]TAG47192.1 MAG: PIN domain-containing protein [Betaproteobacteria bacterium]
MIALDTNVLVRLLLKDDPAQHAAAEKLLAQPRDYAVSVTVMLELVWVLESVGFDTAEVAHAITSIIAQPNIYVHQADAVAAANAHYRVGADFADALHHALCATPKHTAFATFDKKFADFAKRRKLQPSVAPIGA